MPYTQAGLPWAPRSDTSYAAAVAAEPFAGKQLARYAAYMAARGQDGATDKEAHADTGIERSSLCARRRELERLGRIVKTDQRRGRCAVYRWQE